MAPHTYCNEECAIHQVQTLRSKCHTYDAHLCRAVDIEALILAAACSCRIRGLMPEDLEKG